MKIAYKWHCAQLYKKFVTVPIVLSVNFVYLHSEMKTNQIRA